MAGAWGSSWGVSWGVSWGLGASPAVAPRGGGIDLPAKRPRLRFRNITADRLRELLQPREAPAETAPKPTRKRVRAVEREIVDSIEAGGLLGPAKQAVTEFVGQEIVRLYQPDTDWQALAAMVQFVMQRAAAEAARIEQENEEEDIMILFMAA